jgi:hypothetical protein
MNDYDIIDTGYRVIVVFRNGKCIPFGGKIQEFASAQEIADAIKDGRIRMVDGKGQEIRQRSVVNCLVYEETTITRCVYPNKEDKKGELGFLALR